MNPSRITEHQFQKWILESFDGHRNIMLFRRNVGATAFETALGKRRFIRFSEAGQSDIWGIIKEYRCPRCNRLQWGVHFEIELKVGKNKLSAPQEKWIKKVAEFNGNALVLRPDGNEPVGIVNRLERLLYSFICPDCVAKGKREVA
jgi:hypothetical protein